MSNLDDEYLRILPMITSAFKLSVPEYPDLSAGWLKSGSVPAFNLPYPEISLELSDGVSTRRVLAVQGEDGTIACYEVSRSGIDTKALIKAHEDGYIRVGYYPSFGSKHEANRLAGHVAIVCHALTCSNVATEKRSRPKKAKTRWGKAPKGRDTYHVLTVDVTAPEDSSERASKPGSPQRQHWRRGHIRTLKDGRKVWIQPYLAGDPERGFADKDYIVRATP